MKAIIIGIILIGVIIYADSQYMEPNTVATNELAMQLISSSIEMASGNDPDIQYVKDCTEPPYFKTFPEELSWYTQCEPTLMIEESNCDKLVTKYRAGTTQDKINYSFRILELCEV